MCIRDRYNARSAPSLPNYDRNPYKWYDLSASGVHNAPRNYGMPNFCLLYTSGSPDLIAGKADGAENVIRVKATVRNFPNETNMSCLLYTSAEQLGGDIEAVIRQLAERRRKKAVSYTHLSRSLLHRSGVPLFL